MTATSITTAAGPPLQRGAKGTGSRTLADMLPRAVDLYGDLPAMRHKAGGRWVDTSFAQLGEAAREIALGLVDLGIGPGERVAILAHTRPEWAQCSFGIHTAGGVLVTVYQTNSAAECRYVLDHSDARLVFAEDAAQLEKVREVWGQCQRLEHAVVIDPDGVHFQHGEMTRCGNCASAGAGATRRSGRPDTRRCRLTTSHVSIYTSGTTGPPKGCLLTHDNYRMTVDCGHQTGTISPSDCVLPVPAARPRLRLSGHTPGDRRRRHDRLLVARPGADRRRAAARSPPPTSRRCRGSSRRSTASRSRAGLTQRAWSGRSRSG